MGCSQDSNWAASTRYMKTKESKKAAMNEATFFRVSLAIPEVWPRQPGGRWSPATIRSSGTCTSLCAYPGAVLAVMVILCAGAPRRRELTTRQP